MKGMGAGGEEKKKIQSGKRLKWLRVKVLRSHSSRPAVAPVCQTVDADGAGPGNSWSCYFYTSRLKGPPEV